MRNGFRGQKQSDELAAETITPYPPGIPLILQGERIHDKELEVLLPKKSYSNRFNTMDTI